MPRRSPGRSGLPRSYHGAHHHLGLAAALDTRDERPIELDLDRRGPIAATTAGPKRAITGLYGTPTRPRMPPRRRVPGADAVRVAGC